MPRVETRAELDALAEFPASGLDSAAKHATLAARVVTPLAAPTTN